MTHYLHFLLKSLLLVGICKLGLDHYLYMERLQDTNKAQEAILVELIKKAKTPVVEAQTNKETGDVIVRINRDDKNLHYIPQLCPKLWTL